MLQFSFNCLAQEISSSKLDVTALKNILSRYNSGVSHNTLKRHLNVLINEAVSLGMEDNPMIEIKSKKAKSILHKPFDDIATILEDIKLFNKHLHLCCLLTYGCLLRPHREVRELTWGDFSNDLSFITLSGFRNKSGRNRIVPVPSFIKPYLNLKDHSAQLTIQNLFAQLVCLPSVVGSWLPEKRQTRMGLDQHL